MKRSVQLNLPPVPVNSIALAPDDEDKGLALRRKWLREAIDESGWKHDAVAATLGIDGPYLSKMLAGTKPITLKQLDALPDDIEAIYSRKYAEGFGLIVVEPATGEDAARQFVSGLFGLLRRPA